MPVTAIGVYQDTVMILDTRTIFLITFFNVLIMGVGIFAATRTYKDLASEMKAKSHLASPIAANEINGRNPSILWNGNLHFYYV